MTSGLAGAWQEMLPALRAWEKALGIRPDPKSERATQLYLDACKAKAKAKAKARSADD